MTQTKPHHREEQRLHKAGFHLVAGVDEAGRGSWAGPIVAGAVILPTKFSPRLVNDSKKLSPRQREAMFVYITQQAVAWSVAVVESNGIDQGGVGQANRMVLRQAVENLHIQPAAVLVDAMVIDYGNIPSKAIIDGDAKVLSIAAASIIAKVVRDALMVGHDRLYPQYGFSAHKGYGTKLHQQMLRRHGLSPIHRRSFRPVAAVNQRRLAKQAKKR